AAQTAAAGIQIRLRRLEQVVQSGNADEYTALLADSADRARARDFTSSEIGQPASRAVIQERDREPLRDALPGDAYRVMVDVFGEFGNRARASTWRLDLKRVGSGEHPWAISDQERVTSLENLYRLSVNPTRQFTARNLKIGVEDLDLTLLEGSVFVADVDLGVTGVVLLGKGTLSFHPDPQTEKGQVKIFCGSETLDTGFDTA